MATRLPDVLANVPGYGGYLARRNMIEGEQQQELAEAGVLQKLYQNQQTMRTTQEDRASRLQDEAQLKAVMDATGGDSQKAIAALLKAGTPKSIELASKLKGLLPDKAAEQWSEPYNLGGAQVQKNLTTGQIRQAVPRETAASTAAPAVTPVTIQDPNDPTGAATIVIDARTKTTLGKGPKLTQIGTADQKLALSKPQAKLRVNSMIQGIDRLSTAMAELDTDPGLTNITGTLMGRTPNITNLATGAQAKLDSIKSQIFQSSLLAMREASKTGGAVGNVSDREGDKLERTIAALDQAQGTPAFKVQLKKAREQLRLSKELIQRAYDEQFGGVQEQAAGAVREFPNEAAAAAAGLAPGTRIKINGISGTWR